MLLKLMPLSAAAAVASACSSHHGCSCFCITPLPLHAAVNMYAAVIMHVCAIACRGRSDHHGYAAFTTVWDLTLYITVSLL